MTQRIFDALNEKDKADLFDILPEEIKTIYKDFKGFPVYFTKSPEIDGVIPCPVGLFKINWHDKKEITRPIQEATEADVEKICAFWDIDIEHPNYGLFLFKTKDGLYVGKDMAFRYKHCRRLTKQEIEELC